MEEVQSFRKALDTTRGETKRFLKKKMKGGGWGGGKRVRRSYQGKYKTREKKIEQGGRSKRGRSLLGKRRNFSVKTGVVDRGLLRI